MEAAYIQIGSPAICAGFEVWRLRDSGGYRFAKSLALNPFGRELEEKDMDDVRRQDRYERHLVLHWNGPFTLRDGVLTPHALEPTLVPEDGQGLYLITRVFPPLEHQSLAYIGESDSLHTRLRTHYATWLKNEWRPEVYVAYVVDTKLRIDAENLLIRAHFPPLNTHFKARGDRVEPSLRIWNYGRFSGLLPEVSSAHEWNS